MNQLIKSHHIFGKNKILPEDCTIMKMYNGLSKDRSTRYELATVPCQSEINDICSNMHVYRGKAYSLWIFPYKKLLTKSFASRRVGVTPPITRVSSFCFLGNGGIDSSDMSLPYIQPTTVNRSRSSGSLDLIRELPIIPMVRVMSRPNSDNCLAQISINIRNKLHASSSYNSLSSENSISRTITNLSGDFDEEVKTS